MTATLLPAVHDGVEALITRTLYFDERRADPPRTELTERDLDILMVLAELRYLTSTMIAALAWGSYTSRLRDRLGRLFHAGLIRRFRPATIPRGGGCQWVYELDREGHRTLADRRPESCPPWTRSELHSFSYAEHDLELNALLCELAARAARRRRRTGPLLHVAPFRILGPLSGRVDPAKDARPLDADPANELPAGHLLRPGPSRPGPLEPDATLVGRHHATGEPIAILIEYDRTRRASKLAGKLARYDHFLADGWRRTRYARHPDEPAVLFVTRFDGQLAGAVREADRQLGAAVGPSGQTAVLRHPGREELGLTSRTRLMAGEDTIRQVLPAPRRGDPRPGAEVPSVEASLPVAALFGARTSPAAG